MFNSDKNMEYVKYIKILGDSILESDYPLSVLEEFKERYDFCMEELDFWEKRDSPTRREEALRSLLSWLHMIHNEFK